MVKGKSSRNQSKNRILNVRVADSAAGMDGLKADRMLADIKNSESQTRILIGDILDLNTQTTAVSGSYGFDELYATDDFVSMIQQYNLFRVKSIKFEIFDINSGSPVYNTWGIWHDNYVSTAPPYTRQNIADLPDARSLSSGTGQTVLYWMAHGVEENGFQAATSAGAQASKFGGLRYYVGGTATALPKYALHVHAVVDFRGRK